MWWRVGFKFYASVLYCKGLVLFLVQIPLQLDNWLRCKTSLENTLCNALILIFF